MIEKKTHVSLSEGSINFLIRIYIYHDHFHLTVHSVFLSRTQKLSLSLSLSKIVSLSRMGKQLNRHAVPWEPNKVPVPQPPPAVTYQRFPTNYYISDQYYSYYYYSKEEEEFTTYYNYSSYNNNTTHHHSSGERKVVETYKRAAVRRIDGGGGDGPTELGGGLKRVLNVPPRLRRRFVEGRVRRRSFRLQRKPKAENSSKFGCGGGGGGGGVSCEVALASGGGDERLGCGGKTSVMIKNIPNHYR